MNLKGILRLLVCLGVLGSLILAGCSTTKGTKRKCPTCPEWSAPAQPPR